MHTDRNPVNLSATSALRYLARRMARRLHRYTAIVGAIFIVSLLAACGGGGTQGTTAAVITAQPTDQSVVAGTTATFNVASNGATGYQWQSKTNGGTTFTNVNGATAPGYTTVGALLTDSGTQYRVVVTGASNSVTSSAVTLTVTAAPVAPGITVQPTGLTLTAGQNASFSVTAVGTSISYQWQRSTDGGASFANVAAATGATLTLTAVPLASNGQQYNVVVSNSAGSVTSNAALLTVNAAQVMPAFTTQPASITVVAPNTATFNTVATGSPTPTLQWQLSTNGGTSFADIVGATGSSYTTPATVTSDSGKQYRVVATNASGVTNSNAASLTVTAAAIAPTFTTQPVNATIVAGQAAQFTVAASGTPTPTLQWQLSTDSGVNWSNIVGETGTTFTALNVALANNGRQFRAVATNGSGVLNSNAATLTVNAPPPPPLTVAPAFGKIAVGQYHTCAIKTDTTLACWGHNSSSEVLLGNFSDQSAPVVVPGLTGVTQVAVSYQRSCAVANLGILYCWGGGLSAPTPVKDANGVAFTGVKGVAMGLLHTCFIDANTNVRCFGRNSLGQLGDGFPTDPLVDPYVSVPVLVQPVLTGVISLAAGGTGNYTCALTSGGEVICWGAGAIGDGTVRANTAVVPAISSGATAMTVGSGHACAVLAAGGIQCWGGNSTSQLGNRNTTAQLFPVSVIDLAGLLNGVTAIAAADAYTCAVPASGRVVCWGSVSPGSLSGTITYSPTEQGNLISRVVSLAGGGINSCALVADGSMECWGSNQFGQVGVGNTVTFNVGGPFPPTTSVIGGAIFWK